MKRKAIKLKQKAWKYDDMYPSFVSVVKTGANKVPFSMIKMSEDEAVKEGLDIKKITFSLGTSETYVKSFLSNRAIEDYTIQTDEQGRLFVENPSEFSDVKSIVLEDGTEVDVGVTSSAVEQEKTKIEDYEETTAFSEDKEDVVITANEDTADEVVDSEVVETEATDTEVKEEEAEILASEQEVEAETKEEVSEQLSEPKVTAQLSEDQLSVVKHLIDMKLKEHNDYTEFVDNYKIMIMFDTVFWLFRDKLARAFTDSEPSERNGKVMYEATEFGKACVAIYNTLDNISLSEPEEKSVVETEVITDEVSETEEVKLSEETEDTEINKLILSLKEELEAIKKQLANNEEENVDNTKLIMQTSKADVGAYDKPGIEPTAQASQPLSKHTRNLFGI